MSDEPPLPDAAPPASPDPQKCTRRRCNWHRVRVYFWAILICLALWAGPTLVQIKLKPKRIVDGMLAQLPFPTSTGSAKWINRRTLKVDDVHIGNFFNADSVVITASPIGLWRHHVAKVRIEGGQLFTKELAAALDQGVAPASTGTTSSTSTGAGKPESSAGIDWVIGRLEVSHGTVVLDNLLRDTSISLGLGRRTPIVLHSLRLGRPEGKPPPEMLVERTAEIGAVSISSPLDPLAPVLFFPLTRLTFTYDEIWHHVIRGVEFIHPTMFLGEDLFWLGDEFRNNAAPSAPATQSGVSAPWKIGDLRVIYGRLGVNAFGQPIAHLPFYFNTHVPNIRLDQLDRISARASVNIENLSQDYPDYKIGIKNLRGHIFFAWPPTDAKANNVVNDIDIDEISWNGIAAQQVNAHVTFDANGVYGKLTRGICEKGQLNGNFEFYYSKGFTWNADFFANKINCQPISEKLAGKYVDLTGQLNGQIAVQGQATTILSCTGALNLPTAGQLRIKSAHDLLQRLPADTVALKRQALALAIDALDTYPYDTGTVQLNYTPAGGTGTLKLDGTRGRRDFEVNFHPL
jgi:hypothetical protein